MNTTKERIHWVDIAKGLLILLLLVHHFCSATKGSIIPNSDFGFVWKWQFVFTAFFMQAFLFMSGFCSNFMAPVDVFFKKLIKQLVVPFVFFELIVCVYRIPYNQYSIQAVFDYWVESGGTHYWFLNALILSKVYIFIFLRFYKNESHLVLSSLILLAIAVFLNDYDIGSNFLCFRQSLGSIFFVALGFFVKNRQKLLEKKRLMWGGIIYVFALFFLFVVLGKRPPVFTAGMGVKMISLTVFLVTSVTGIMAFTFTVKK